MNEDNGLITAYFRENGGEVVKSYDYSVEYHSSNFTGCLKHRPQEEGPAVITAEGDYEYWGFILGLKVQVITLRDNLNHSN